jgi:hypothetical protein
MERVAALKNQAIDCSNPAAYLKKVENRFQFLPEGLKFFFSAGSAYHFDDKIPILLTWAELKPFLKE